MARYFVSFFAITNNYNEVMLNDVVTTNKINFKNSTELRDFENTIAKDLNLFSVTLLFFKEMHDE